MIGKVLVLFFCIFANKVLAYNVNIGSCSIKNLDVAVIEVSVNDDKALNATYSIKGNLYIGPETSDETGTPYIEAKIIKDKLQITTNSNFTKFEENQEVHYENPSPLVKHFKLICDDGATNALKILLTVNDVNNHAPKFTVKSYSYNFPKKLSPDVDLTTAIDAVPIIVEDLDFTNTAITFSIHPPSDIFEIDSEATDASRKTFRAILKAKEYVTVNKTITFNVTATDNGNPQKNSTVTVKISSPNMFGDCILNDNGELNYNFFLYTMKDVDTLNTSILYEGPLSLETLENDDTGASYIEVKTKNNKIIFNTTSNFSHFEYDQRAQSVQPTLTVYRSVHMYCGAAEKSFTFGLKIEDTNNNAPEFTEKTYEYSLSKQLMPKVDLTSLGDPIIVEDVDFSNTDITFEVDDPTFLMETVVEDNPENRRQYRGILRVSKYITLSKDITLKITATDSGTPPLQATASVVLKIDTA